MSANQDWTTVVIKKRKPKPKTGNIRTSNQSSAVNNARRSGQHVVMSKKYDYGNHHHKDLRKYDDNPEDFHLKHVSKSIRQNLTKARNDKGWTQAQLASASQIPKKVVASYENGKAIPDEREIRKLEKALGAKLRQGKKKQKKNTQQNYNNRY